MISPIIRQFQYGNHMLTLETGVIARQANAAVMVSMGDTAVLVTVVIDTDVQSGQDFFPLTVHYQERSYSVGKFPGGFFRREGRPTENEILTSRLIDRPIRPLFPERFMNEVQIIATVVSVNPQINPDILGIIGASAALSLSGVPFFGPVGAARVGYVNGQYVLNPTTDELIRSRLDLVIAGTESSILMVESASQFLSEEEILEALIFGHRQQKLVIENIHAFVMEAGKRNCQVQIREINNDLQLVITNLVGCRFLDAYSIVDKKSRYSKIDFIKGEVIDVLTQSDRNVDKNEISHILHDIEKNIVRQRILQGQPRIDGRSYQMIRELDIRTGILPRTHGSALFTRGETQVLVSTTLGTERDAQNIDELTGERIDRFLLHYNFQPYCVGEIGVVSSPKRREIGHGRLAKRGMLAVMPNMNEFPYTIRVVSEVTESNGSSSMASICGASLSLMDAGVPIKSSVAGIAMGLVKQGDNFVVLSDIMSDEDRLGDMDFKISGNRNGITALQMDIKNFEITYEIIGVALNQAKGARFSVLDVMDRVIKLPRKHISSFAPRIHIIKINQDKIKNLIGKGGSVIRSLIEETKTTIEIEDDGTVQIASVSDINVQHAIRRIKEITSELEIGVVYTGKVTHIVNFGAFVALLGGSKEGLVHISQISKNHVDNIDDYLSVGQDILVKVLEIDRQGRVRLSMKDI
ncbi:polyribonucleotide nucleotidyltransferase [Blochmannia endosymbiont of Polyrhachis (Hedomyrma) turneri]|uniref:polyribonucleotide nucleotidyltransferase n=1 Tax=Blochmannia endosymbiont of Polyrhachis (Hedomyrma) turneri TaxID=1505596 RepID=UPI00061A814E|nr:polyribonucleotide nucleotidyltransferase [Blochmannia endosymbiont of Polyrhachis (Hedomyrma) turneri]AKC59693.1 Polyribonucleotide nucleotidyltransferase [Blochmannia endosymbiont of Polyrhachis (Hedomyrma) turneri]